MLATRQTQDVITAPSHRIDQDSENLTPRTGCDSPGSLRFLQRNLGNSHWQSTSESEQTPRLVVKTISWLPKASHAEPASARSPKPDKSTSGSAQDQDQTASLTTLAATASGVHVEVEGQGLYSSTDYPDSFKWTQTIATNNPLHGATSPYVDPHPNDDTKPFYWTDAETAAHPTTFIDFPNRSAPATGTTTWDATLALNGVNEATKTVKSFNSLTYGFDINSAGTVNVHAAKSVGTAAHRATLASEFPSWTFS